MQQAIDILKIKAEKLINLSYDEVQKESHIDKAIRNNSIKTIRECVDELQALGDGWISTAIQLPPEDTNVLIFEGGQSNLSGWNEPKIGWYNKKFGFQSLTDYLIATHWMNLPDSPI